MEKEMLKISRVKSRRNGMLLEYGKRDVFEGK